MERQDLQQFFTRIERFGLGYILFRITSDVEFMSATATREQVQRFSLRTGDVLITKDSESWTDIAVPAVVAEDMPEVLCGYHLAHVRPADCYVGAFLSRAFAAIGPATLVHLLVGFVFV